ncbi:PD-(D/E)XK nuclease family protein [Agrococcus casei]|uniref:PD-(D/E)XK nuclease family protein n=1 Tax=Agrococcus casei TaxID=343512 RepID=UPI003F91DC82
MMNQQPELGSEQLRVVALAPQSRVRLLGAPGSGKTTAAVACVTQFIADGGAPDRVLLLTGSRETASRLRDRIARALAVTTPGPLARTFASLAHAIVRQRSMAEHGAPSALLGGSDEDARWREVLEIDGASADGVVWPSHLREQVRLLPEFRAELREFIARATERGMTPDDLLEHALNMQQPNETWQAVARIWKQFEFGLLLESGDSARIVTTPSLLREATQIAAAGQAPEFDLLVIDDAQELTQGQLEFVEALAGAHDAKTGLVIAGDPDVATGMFRGAQPGIMNSMRVDETIRLPKSHRMGGAVASAYRTVVERVGVAGSTDQRQFAEAGHDAEALVQSAPSAAAEARLIADELRERHIVAGVPWSQMAVITRTSGLARQLTSALVGLDVPTSRSGSTALRGSVAVQGLIDAMAIATGRQELDAVTLLRLLSSPFIDLDSLQLRRLRRALRVQLLADDSALSVDERLVELFTSPDDFDAFPQSRVIRRARRLATVLSASSGSADASPQDLLWQLWEGFGTAEAWAEQAGGDGVVARAANERLDAVVALMRHVGFVAERHPTMTALQFVEQWQAASVEDDSLAGRGAAETVAVGTPSSFLGREFDTVCVAGVNDAVWPNLRLRSSLLDAAAFVRGSASREEVRSDEARLLALAVSRAANRLLVTAVDSADSDASEFAVRLGITAATARNATTLGALTAQLRRTLTDFDSDTAERARAAAALRLLADRGVEGAHPDAWAGRQALSEPAPHAEEAEEIDLKPQGVSPSKIERFEECQVQWVVGNLSGDSIGTHRQIGTIIHAAVEHARLFTADELEGLALAHWDELQFSAPWEDQRSRAELREIVERLETYFELVQSQGYRIDTQLREAKFSADVDGVELRGSIDWVERGPDGVRIADLKTGKSAPSKEEVSANPQLQSYQLAVATGAVEGLSDAAVVDARLVYPSKTTKKPETWALKQEPLTESSLQEFRERVLAAAEQMSGTSFIAHPSSHCENSDGFRPDCAFHIIEQATS